LLKKAQLKDRTAVMEGIDYPARAAGSTGPQLASLTTCDLDPLEPESVNPRCDRSGKTYLACALAHQACRAGLSAW